MSNTDTTTGAASAAAATSYALSMTTTPPAIKGFFDKLLSKIEAIPGSVSRELDMAKSKAMLAIDYVESHFQIAKATAETDAAVIKTDAKAGIGDIEEVATGAQAAVEKAV